MSKPEIYFHVGLGKVASTYLQHRVFPKLEGIRYIPTGKYKKSKEIIKNENHDKFLVSREFDVQFEREVRWFTKTYPEARIIILFRRHESWIASQYRRYVKNGWFWNFDKFFDLENDAGFWKKKDLFFYPKLEIIEECSSQKPLVLFHEELKEDPWIFFDKISQYSNTTYYKDKISLERVHTSYSEKQLKILRKFCREYVGKVPKGYSNKVKHWIYYRPWWAFFHLVMYIASVLPERMVPEEELISTEQLDSIRQAYEEDWNKIREYARKNNPPFTN